MTHTLDPTNRIPRVPFPDNFPAAPHTADVSYRRGTEVRAANAALNISATAWFVVAAIGQLMFCAYLLGFYGRAAIHGRFETWNEVLPRGYVPGDTVGNLVVAMHLGFAVLIILAGLAQVTIGVRRHFPRFHRWNGRIYLVLAFVMSLGGLVMVWTGGGVGDLAQHIAISINAVLIMLCGGMALRHARARRFAVHRRWALRLFLVVNGVWFFRLGLPLWIVVNQGPVGFDPDAFTGPALTTLAFAQYLLPLGVLELYFRAQASNAPSLRMAMAAGLGVLTLMTVAGIGAASMMLWLPQLQ